jgi:hypothetical protein
MCLFSDHINISNVTKCIDVKEGLGHRKLPEKERLQNLLWTFISLFPMLITVNP